MILLIFDTSQGLMLGVKTPEGVLDVGAAADALQFEAPITPSAFFSSGLAALESVEKLLRVLFTHPQRNLWTRAEDELTLGPCVPAPGKIICQYAAPIPAGCDHRTTCLKRRPQSKVAVFV